MWRIIIVAALLGAVTAAGYKTPISSYVKPLDDDDDIADPTTTSIAAAVSSTTLQAGLSTDAAPASSSSSSSLTSSTTVKSTELPPEFVPSEIPISLPMSPDPQDGDDINDYRRRVITYDQRQEGQYNIRADLENFMIVLIPPNPAEGLNLLDLLTKSSLRRNAHSTTSKGKRKNNISSGLPGIMPQQQSAANRFRQSIRAGNNNQNFNYLTRPSSGAKNGIAAEQQSHQPPQHQHHLSIADGPGPSPARFQEFIEGRTPYHVDISSSDGEQSRLQPDRQVDVIPPPYPLSYQHLIKPFHLEAEPTVIQALPPSGLSPNTHGANNFLETYNQLLAAGLQDDIRAAANSPHSGAVDSNYYRVSRAIRSDHLLDTNSVTESNSLSSNDADMPSYKASGTLGLLPIYRAGLSLGAAKLYPPIDVPQLTGDYLNIGSNARTFSLSSGEEHDLDDAMLDEIIAPAQALPAEDDLDLDLSSASYISSGAKRLLGDGGLERCAPGRRRDSYGVCREIEGY